MYSQSVKLKEEKEYDMVNILNEDFDFNKKYPEYLYRKGFVLKNRIFAPSQTEIIFHFSSGCVPIKLSDGSWWNKSVTYSIQIPMLEIFNAPISSKYKEEQLSLLIPGE